MEILLTIMWRALGVALSILFILFLSQKRKVNNGGLTNNPPPAQSSNVSQNQNGRQTQIMEMVKQNRWVILTTLVFILLLLSIPTVIWVKVFGDPLILKTIVLVIFAIILTSMRSNWNDEVAKKIVGRGCLFVVIIATGSLLYNKLDSPEISFPKWRSQTKTVTTKIEPKENKKEEILIAPATENWEKALKVTLKDGFKHWDIKAQDPDKDAYWEMRCFTKNILGEEQAHTTLCGGPGSDKQIGPKIPANGEFLVRTTSPKNIKIKVISW